MDKLTSELEVQALVALIDRYWELAYAEGKEDRDHDTENGDAQATRDAIETALRRLAGQGVERYPKGAFAYIGESGSTLMDWDRDPQRQLSLIIKGDGSVAWAIYLNGERLNGANADSPEFIAAVHRWSDPREVADNKARAALATDPQAGGG